MRWKLCFFVTSGAFVFSRSTCTDFSFDSHGIDYVWTDNVPIYSCFVPFLCWRSQPYLP